MKGIDTFILIFLAYYIHSTCTTVTSISYPLISPNLTCIYYNVTDYPICSTCISPRPIHIIDFTLHNNNSAINNCNFTYFDPLKIHVDLYTTLTLNDLILMDPLHSTNATYIVIQVFNQQFGTPTYSLRFSGVELTDVFLSCHFSPGISCSPYHSPFTFYGFGNSSVQVGYFYSTPGALCQCDMFVPLLGFHGTDKLGNNCSFSNSTLTINPLIRVMGCFDPISSKRRSIPTDFNQGLYNHFTSLNLDSHLMLDDFGRSNYFKHNKETDYSLAKRDLTTFALAYQPSANLITCLLTSTDSTDYLLITRIAQTPSIYTLSWDGNVIGERVFNGSVDTYILPSEVSAAGGSINVVVLYPDLSWATCGIILEATDPCLNPNLNLGNMPSQCRSGMLSTAYGTFEFAAISLGILAVGLCTYIFIQIILTVIGCYMGAKGVRTSRVGKWVSGGIASASGAFKPEEVEAMSIGGYEAADVTIKTLMLFILVLSFVLALIFVIIKFMRQKRLRNTYDQVVKEEDLKSQNIRKAAADIYKKVKSKGGSLRDYMRPSVGTSLVLILIGSSSVSPCSNIFGIQSPQLNCIPDGYGGSNCSPSVTLEATYSGIGSCTAFYSDDPNHPFGLEIDLINSGYVIDYDILYWSQMATCYGQAKTVCDEPLNQLAVNECELFENSIGETCTVIDDGSTGFPADTGVVFTRCQCTLFYDNDFECQGILGQLSMGKQFAYSYPKGLSDPFPVYKSRDIVPFYQFSITRTDSSPETFPCIVTPFSTYCSGYDIKALLTSNTVNLESSAEMYFYNDNNSYRNGTSWYYTNFAQSPGTTNSCHLGNIQLDENRTLGGNIADVYSNFCTVGASPNSDSVPVYGCANYFEAYGNLLPYQLPGVGLLQVIPLGESGFSGMVITGAQAAQVTMKFSISGNFTFSNNVTEACPVFISVTPIVGCYDCKTPATYSLTARSNCYPDVVYIKCNIDMLTTAMFLNTTSEGSTKIISFYATSANVQLTCTLIGGTQASYTTETTVPLTQGAVDLGIIGTSVNYTVPLDSSSWSSRFIFNKLPTESYMTFAILIISSIVFVSCGIGILICVVYCVWKLI